MNSQQKAKELLESLKRKEDLEAQLSTLEKDIFKASCDLHDSMEEEILDSISLEGIEFKPIVERQFKLADSGIDEKISWDIHPKFLPWLKQIGEGGLIKIKETVHWKSRVSFLMNFVDKGNFLPEFIAEVFLNTVKYNKSAIKRLVNGGQ